MEKSTISVDVSPYGKLGDVPFGHVSFRGMYFFLFMKVSPLYTILYLKFLPFFLQR